MSTGFSFNSPYKNEPLRSTTPIEGQFPFYDYNRNVAPIASGSCVTPVTKTVGAHPNAVSTRVPQNPERGNTF